MGFIAQTVFAHQYERSSSKRFDHEGGACKKAAEELKKYNQGTTPRGVATQLVQLCGGNREQAVKYLKDVLKEGDESLKGIDKKSLKKLEKEIKRAPYGLPKTATARRLLAPKKILKVICEGTALESTVAKLPSNPRKKIIKKQMRHELLGLVNRKPVEITRGEHTITQLYGVASFANKCVEKPKNGQAMSAEIPKLRETRTPSNVAVAIRKKTSETGEGTEEVIITRSGRTTNFLQTVQVFCTDVSQRLNLDSATDPPAGLTKSTNGTYEYQPVESGLMDRDIRKSALTAAGSVVLGSLGQDLIGLQSTRAASSRPIERERAFMQRIDDIAEMLFDEDKREKLSAADLKQLEEMGIQFKGNDLTFQAMRGTEEVTVIIKKPIVQSHVFNNNAKSKRNVRDARQRNQAGQVQMLQMAEQRYPAFKDLLEADGNKLAAKTLKTSSNPAVLSAALTNLSMSDAAQKDPELALLLDCFHAQLTGRHIDSNTMLEKASDQAELAVMLAIQCRLLNLPPSTFCKSGNDRTPLSFICHLVTAEILYAEGGAQSLLDRIKKGEDLINEDFQNRVAAHMKLAIDNVELSRGKGKKNKVSTLKIHDNPVANHIFGDANMNKLGEDVYIKDRTK